MSALGYEAKLHGAEGSDRRGEERPLKRCGSLLQRTGNRLPGALPGAGERSAGRPEPAAIVIPGALFPGAATAGTK